MTTEIMPPPPVRFIGDRMSIRFDRFDRTAYVAVGGKSPMTGLSLESPRHVIGFELKDSYYRASLDYVGKAQADAVKVDASLFADTPPPLRKRKGKQLSESRELTSCVAN